MVTAASQTAIPTATSSVTGLLTSSDWSTFNGKQAQLNGTGFVKVSGTTVTYDNSTYLTTIEGITAGGELSGTYASPSLVNSAVTGKVLTGLNVTGGTVIDTDSILTAFGKVQNQLNSLLGGSSYQGTWNASTNTPTLTSGVGTKGYYYIVSVAGTTNLDGITDWNIGDWAIYDGTAWQQVDNTDAVVSVNGFTGAVSLTTTDISEGTNQYFTTSRARQSVSAGTGISYDNSTGIITNSAPDQTVSLTASTGISTSGTYPNFTITNTAPDQTVSLTASTGISTSGTYPNFTITNTAPDQTVSLTGAGTTSITGTYPNFTVTSNDQYVGTVTSVGITESAAALTITGSPVTTSGNINIGFAGASTDYVAGDGSLVPFPTVVTQAQNLVTQVYNQTGATLTKGTIVYVNGGHGNLPTVTKAIATSDLTSAQTYGVVRTDITNNNNGYVTVIGNLDNIDTQAYSAGTQLYLSGTTAGAWTSIKPYAPIHLVYVGIVVRSHPTQGVVEIRIQNGYEMDELHNVSAQNPNNGDILQYVSSTSLWTKTAGTTTNIAEGTNLYYTQARFDSAFGAKTTSNLTEGTNLYYTDARARGAISLTTTGNNGASTYNSTTGVLNVPTYTLAGLGGINLTSLSATSPLLYDNTTGVFSIQQSSGSQAGFLSAADWTTFNNKQAALGYTPVPQTRTLTINGVGYDLSADRSWTVTPNVNATNTQDYTATATQTTFTVTGGYTVGQLAVFYNGSKLASNEYSAINGTTFTLATACQANDIVQAVVAVTGGGIGGSGTTNTLSKWTASGVLGNSIIQESGNSIGIGVTPTSIVKTDILLDATAVTGLQIRSSDAGTVDGSTTVNVFRTVNNSGGNWANARYNAYDHIFMSTGSTERMRITSAGNVGIGTSSPSAKLEVNDANGIPLRIQDISAAITGQTAGYIGMSTSAFSGNNGDLVLYPRTSATSNILLMGGNVGISVIPSAWNANYKAINIGNAGFFYSRTVSDETAIGTNWYRDSAGLFLYKSNGFATFYDQSSGNHAWYNAPSGTGGAAVSLTERMRITSGGSVQIGTTSVNLARLNVVAATASQGIRIEADASYNAINIGGTGNFTIDFPGIANGRFLVDNSGNTYNRTGVYGTVSSDLRLKENIIEASSKLNDILKLRVVNFNLISDTEKKKNIGFIAQELQEVFPSLVYEADTRQYDEDGNVISGLEDALGIKVGMEFAILVKAIQEQQAQIEELKALINK